MTPAAVRPRGLVPYPRVEVGSVVVARDPAGLDVQVIRRPHEAFGPGVRVNRAVLPHVASQHQEAAEQAAQHICRQVPSLAPDIEGLRLSSIRFQAERLGGEQDLPWRPAPDPWAGMAGYSTYVVCEALYATLTLEVTYSEGVDMLSGRSLAATATAVDAQGAEVVAMTEQTLMVRLGALRIETSWCPLPPSAPAAPGGP